MLSIYLQNLVYDFGISFLKIFLPILLFVLLIFNMMGFSIYNIAGHDDQEKVPLNETVQEFLLKIPISLPYAAEWQTQEPAEGELMQGADYYDIVSRKMLNDTLFVKCRYKENARDRFWNLVSTFEDQVKSSKESQKNQNNSLLKNLLKEYMANGRKLTFFILDWAFPATYKTFVAHATALSEYGVTVPPPDFVQLH